MIQADGMLGAAHLAVAVGAYIVGASGFVAMLVMSIGAYHRESKLARYWPYLALLAVYVVTVLIAWAALHTNWLGGSESAIALALFMLVYQVAILAITGRWTWLALREESSP